MDNRGDILVVDDTLANLQLLSDLLKAEGYMVRASRLPKIALESALAAPPDLILLDIKMPDMDGFEVCQKLKEDERTAGVPVIFISALQEVSDRIRGFEVGGVDFITKPIQHTEVLARVSAHLELYQTRERLQETTRIWEAILAASNDFIAVIDKNGVILDVNGFAADRLNMNPAAIRGMNAYDLMPDKLRSKRRSSIKQVILSKREQRSEDVVDGLYLANVIYPVLNIHGEVDKLVLVSSDITERKELEIKSRQRLEELAHFSRISTVGEMTTEIAHELNQPLTSISSYSETLRQIIQSEQWDNNNVLDSLGEITHQAQRAASIIRRLRSLVRKDETFRSQYDVNSIIDELLQLSSMDSRWSDVEVNTELNEQIPMIFADKVLLEQVILNLIINALDAMSDKDVTERKLTIRTSLNDNGLVVIEISDSGHGLNTEQCSKVFEPFYTTKKSGMGMGLSICKSIIDDNGGNIWAESTPGNGSQFRFTIPVITK